MSGLQTAGRPDLCDIGELLLPSPCQLIDDVLIFFGPEKLPEDFFFLIRVRPQNLHEFSLRDHGDLRELRLCKADNIDKLRVGLLLRIYGSIRHLQRYGF